MMAILNLKWIIYRVGRGSGPSMGRVGSVRVGSQNSPSLGSDGSDKMSKIYNKCAIYMQEIRRL